MHAHTYTHIHIYACKVYADIIYAYLMISYTYYYVSEPAHIGTHTCETELLIYRLLK